ncbi:MAG TPA: POTRA domain-containing protein, partial [Gammaproteobacteria bacterium]|nr:POTRA domain-containing protein [Gammaproteobacteria bacterium]
MAMIDKRSFLLLLVGSLAFFQVEAFQSFVVNSIRVEGLQRVSKGAVLEDLPVQIGQTITDAKATEAIRALYKSGFFKEVTLNRDGNALVVSVIERPTISHLTLTGIKDKDKVKKLLREVGVAEGQLFDPAILLRAQKELERYYYSRGRYGVKIEPTVTEEGSLVSVTFAIYEGDVARIKEIKIMGNTLFPEKELLKEFRTVKTNWLSW